MYSQPPIQGDSLTLENLGLDPIAIPKITEQDKERLDENYSVEELRKALGLLKCPGCDGLMVEFFITF